VEEQLKHRDEIVSIGRMNPNCKAYLGDAMTTGDHQIQGELYVSGCQNFKGYLNGNRDRFVEIDGVTYYKTGDIVMYDEQEELYYYAGRADREVKHYGHRINLDNVESIFNVLGPIVSSAAIYSRKHMSIGLFITSDAGFNLDDNMHLLNDVPSYLTPAHFFNTENFPLNANFKKDYKTLELFYNFYLEKKHGDS
jgi:long-subunit acyl-CoA synthetase (AMP-forming)